MANRFMAFASAAFSAYRDYTIRYITGLMSLFLSPRYQLRKHLAKPPSSFPILRSGCRSLVLRAKVERYDYSKNSNEFISLYLAGAAEIGKYPGQNKRHDGLHPY